MYAFWNVLGVWLYNLTPIAILFYHKLRGLPAELGFVWQLSYPFDKTKPVYHELVYIFETCSGEYVLSILSISVYDDIFINFVSISCFYLAFGRWYICYT